MLRKMKHDGKSKVLIVVDTMTIGGTEKISVMLANRFVERGYDCRILVLKGDFASTPHVDHSVRICAALRRYRLDVSYVFKIRRTICEYEPDFILCQALFSYFSVKAATFFLLGIPTFLVLHYTYNVSLKDEIFDFLYYFLLRFGSDDIITIYKKQGSYFSSKYNIPLRRFRCIYNGVDTSFYKNNDRGRDRFFNIVHIANMREEKDQITLMKALKMYDNEFKEWRFTFCGADRLGYKAKLMKYLSSVHIDGKVRFVDKVDDVRPFLKNASVFALSSVSEALPISALEAMSMGVPCILTNVGGCSEIVDDGVNGFLVGSRDPNAIAEKLLYLAKHPDRLENMRREARKKVVTTFSANGMVDAYLSLFNRYLQKGDS